MAGQDDSTISSVAWSRHSIGLEVEMKFEQHCEETERLFGKPYEEVHRWLDELMWKGLGPRHRRKRHHEAGIRQVVKLFGEEAGRVARQHIVTDLKEEGWTEQDPFPKDEEHYVKMGLF